MDEDGPRATRRIRPVDLLGLALSDLRHADDLPLRALRVLSQQLHDRTDVGIGPSVVRRFLVAALHDIRERQRRAVRPGEVLDQPDVLRPERRREPAGMIARNDVVESVAQRWSDEWQLTEV